MLIGISKRFVFIANTKTGSSTITSALSKYSEIQTEGEAKRKHISWNETMKEFGYLFDKPEFAPEKLFRFGVIREPADWVRSWYNYRRFNQRMKLSTEMTFEELWHSDDWIKKKSQKAMFADNDGHVRFDLIIPHEELKGGLPVILTAMNVTSGRVKDKNVSVASLARKDIDPTLWDEINQYYAEDYSFYLQCKELYPRALQLGLEKIAANASQENTLDKALLDEIEQRASVIEDYLLPCTGTNRSLRVIQKKNKSVFIAWMDSNLGEDCGKRIILHGVVLLNPNAYEGAKLVLIDNSGQTRDVSWGRPSSGLAKKFPNNIRAHNSKFFAGPIPSKKGETAEIALVDASQKVTSIFKFELT